MGIIGMGQFHFKQKRTAYYPLLLVAFCLIPLILPAAINNRGSSSFYIDEYGVLAPGHSKKVEQAHIVFNRLIRANSADNQSHFKLIVLPKTAANWENWAMSLPDGTIVLVENLLDVCFDESDKISEKGKARLAFILAHEIAHLNGKHHTYLQHGHSLQFQNNNAFASWENLRKIEANADYSGLILMTMAEYQPRFLMDQSNFFLEYIKSVRSNFSFDSHDEPIKRMRVLKNNLKPLINELPLFANGVKFFEQREYKKAIENFQQFAAFFPGREVYNNIGLAYYQLALQDLALYDSKNLYRFMLSTKVDRQTLAINLVPGIKGSPKSIQNQFKHHLQKAESNLGLAISKDPEYLPAKINLSSVLITSDKSEPALELLQDVLRKKPADTEALNNKAIALYIASPERNARRAVSILDMVAENSFGSSQRFSRYNKARIRAEQLDCYTPGTVPDDDECLLLAKKSWSPFLKEENEDVYNQRVRLELGENRQRTDEMNENRRIALVIGNSSYTKSPLLNPVNDAAAMRNTLERLGFEVHLGLDLNRLELLRLIDRFGSRLTPDSTGLVFYSGHGLQVNGENLLLPIELEVQSLDNLVSLQEKGRVLRDISVSLQVILKKLAEAGNLQNIVIVDACRDNPIPGLSEEFQGFAEMSAPPRTYVAYATSPGKIAWDGLDGDNGIFTRSLLRHIGIANIDIHELFQAVRKDVANKTGNYQITWDVSTLDEAYYFNPAKPQDWTWHIAAGAIALIAAWQSKAEARNYRQLSSENDLLIEKYGSSINLAQYLDIRELYYVNQEKMKTHKRNYQTLDVITAAALIWGAYLFMYETYDEGIYDTDEDILNTNFVLFPNNQQNTYGFSVQWRW